MATPEPSTAPSVPDRPLNSGQPAGSQAYRGQAGRYDRRTDAFRRWRELVVAQLPAQTGDTVLDVGCGTGLCLPLRQHKVGPSGTIVGIDASAPDARGRRSPGHEWRLLAGFVDDLQVTELGAGGGYLAVGHTQGPLDTNPQSDTQQ